MKNIFISIMLTLLILSLSSCSDGKSEKWQFDNPDLTESERAELKKATEFITSVESKNSWRSLDGNDWTYILTYFPEKSEKCDELNVWHKLVSSNWAKLISEDIRFQKTFEKVFSKRGNPYGIFNSEDWILMISKQPGLKDNAEESKALENFKGNDWKNAIISGVEYFIKKCDEYDGWSKLKIEDWANVVKEKPTFEKKFFEYVNVEKLSKNDWGKLITINPEKYISLAETNNVLKNFPARELLVLLEKNPKMTGSIMKHIKWSDFSTNELVRLMKQNPDMCESLINYIEWNKVSRSSDYRVRECREIFLEVLANNDKLLEKCPKDFIAAFEKNEWMYLLGKNYEIIKYANEQNIWDNLYFPEWNTLLKNNKKYIAKFIEKQPWKTWQSHNAEQLWEELIKVNPDSVELKNAKELALRTKEEWFAIIIKDPDKFNEFCIYYNVIKPKLIDGTYTYSETPSMKNVARKNKKISKKSTNSNLKAYRLSSDDWRLLIENNPKIEELYADEYKVWELVLNPADKFILATKNKKFVEKLKNPSILRYFSESDWDTLVQTFPEFLGLYKKSKRYRDDWLNALIKDYENEKDDFIGFGAYKDFDGDDLVKLLWLKPEILDYLSDKGFAAKFFAHRRLKLGEISSALYYLIKNKKDKRAFALLEAIAKPMDTANPNAMVLISEGELQDSYYYMARCYREGYCVNKDLGKSNYFYYLYGEHSKIKSGELDPELEKRASKSPY